MVDLIVEIDEKGNMKYQTTGFRGKACMVLGNAFKSFLKGFGVEISDEQMEATPEFHEPEVAMTENTY